jgi:flavodoxin
MSSNILIAYFSREGNNYVGGNIANLAVGNTEVSAKIISKITGGDLFRIDPVKKYSTDYHTCTEEAQKELHDNARPELTSFPESVNKYNTVVLDYPNYWGTMPMSVWTFLKNFDFFGKPFYHFAHTRAAEWAAVKRIFGSSVPVSSFRRASPSGGAALKMSKTISPHGLTGSIERRNQKWQFQNLQSNTMKECFQTIIPAFWRPIRNL